MSFLFSLLPTILVLGGLILIHEFGHFIACRLLGVKVEKFSIGFGPELLSWQGRETKFVLSLLPLGGFVKPQGESVSEIEEGREPEKGDYLAAPLFSRITIVSAGVIMNYLLAFVLFTVIFLIGRPIPGTTIGGFVEDYPAIESALEEGDRIVQVGAEKVTNWAELTMALDAAPNENVALIVERSVNGDRLQLETITVSPRVESFNNMFGEPVTVKRLGIKPHPQANEFIRFGLLGSIREGWLTMWDLTVTTHKAIFYLIMGKLSPKTLAGPIGIIAITGSAAQLGIVYVLQLAAMLSVSLAVINLLPIPALDGGHLLFLIIEGIRKKRVSLEAQERASQVGFVLLMMLMVFVIYNDLVNLNVYDKVVNMFGGGS